MQILIRLQRPISSPINKKRKYLGIIKKDTARKTIAYTRIWPKPKENNAFLTGYGKMKSETAERLELSSEQQQTVGEERNPSTWIPTNSSIWITVATVELPQYRQKTDGNDGKKKAVMLKKKKTFKRGDFGLEDRKGSKVISNGYIKEPFLLRSAPHQASPISPFKMSNRAPNPSRKSFLKRKKQKTRKKESFYDESGKERQK